MRNQSKIIKNLYLFSLLDMSIICQDVHVLELRKFLFFLICIAHLPVKETNSG